MVHFGSLEQCLLSLSEEWYCSKGMLMPSCHQSKHWSFGDVGSRWEFPNIRGAFGESLYEGS